MSSVKRCCRSCPRCDDCPALAQLALRGRRDEDALGALISEVFAGPIRRELPEAVTRTLATLDQARRREPLAV